MKRLTIALSIAALALPLWAQDKPNTTTTVLAQPPAAEGGDSPLVKAAKATQKTKTKKASIVITNDTLTKSGGHLYVANQTPNPPLPAALPQPDAAAGQAQAALKAKAAADAKTKQDDAAKKEKKLKAASADYYGESIEERVQDPAQQEHAMEQMTTTQPATATSAQPQTATPTKPPQE